MRSKGEGSITERKDGRFQGSVMFDGKRHYVYGKTRKEVAEGLRKLREQHERGADLGTREQKVKDYLDRWLEEVVKVTNGPRTYKRYKELVTGYISPGLGHHKLRGLNPQHVQSFIGSLPASLSPTTRAKIRGVLITALNNALTWRLIEYNAAVLTKPPKVEKYEARVFTPEEAGRFLAVISGHRLEALYLLAIALGPRKGELLGLRKTDVDLPKREFFIRGQIQLIEGKAQWVPGKTDASRRRMPIPEGVVPALERALAMQTEVEWLFPSEVGTPILPRNLVRQFKELLKKAGLPEEIRFHDLRHFAATNLLGDGASIRDTMELLGHTKASTTLNIYAHAIPERRHSVVNSAVNKLFEKARQDE